MEICRACLMTELNMLPLDESFVNNYNLLTNLNVTLQDRMPQSVCKNCAKIVRSFIEFREKSNLSEKTLWKILQDEKLEDETRNKIKLCIKQEVKTENTYDDYFYEPTDYEEENEEQFSSKIKVEPAIKQRKHKKSAITQNKKSNKKKKVEEKLNYRVVKQKKNDAGKFILCGICKNKFEDSNNLKSHLEMHTKYKECDICHERFSAWPSLLSHRLEHLPEKQGHCHLCNKRFVSSIYLEYHYLTAHNDGQQISLKCKFCLQSFKTPKKLRSHIFLTHSGPRFLCDHCSKGFTCKSALKNHIKTHSDHKSVVCDLCGFQCHLKSNLKAHKLRKHTPNTITCKACKVIFTSQEKHDSHICKVKEVTCPHCGKMKTSITITRHLHSHKGTVYQCARCPAAYKTPGALRVHADRHDGVRRLQCDFCPAKFFSHSVLSKHRRTHTGEKPYVCKICSKAFTGNNNLKVHMKVHGIFTVIKKDSLTENISDIFKENVA